MNISTKAITPAIILLLSASALAANSVESALDKAFTPLESNIPGKFSLDARLRYEHFDLDRPGGTLPDGTPAQRDGTSFRVRYGYTTPDFNGFTAMVEGESLTRVGGDVNEIHPLDEAGDGTDLNQLWLRYAHEDYGSVKAGRQIFALDDHRFIGHVGWRQNIQTFDAVTGAYSGIEDLLLQSFYLAEQHAVNGTHNELEAGGLNAAYEFSPALKLTGFFYHIEGSDRGNANASNQTIGLRATGSFQVEGQSFTYAASLAEQEAVGPSILNYDAGYLAGDLSTELAGLTLGGGFEIFEPGFRTPLATVHKFNGFADALLATNGFTNGLEDFYAYLGYTLPVGSGIETKAIYHWFDPESGAAPGQDGGSEINLVAKYPLNKYTHLLAKYGNYQEDGGIGNAGALDKEMFTFEINFKY